MTILVDMDDVLEKLVVGWVEVLNQRYNLDVKPEEVDDWNIAKTFPMLTKEQVFEVAEEAELWYHVKPIEGAREALEKLIAKGHDIVIVTASVYRTLQVKMEEVLFKYFPFITWNQVIVTSRKQLIKGDVLIDDAPHNLINGDYHKILFTAGHNRKFDEKSIGAVRVDNWDEALIEIEKIEKLF